MMTNEQTEERNEPNTDTIAYYFCLHNDWNVDILYEICHYFRHVLHLHVKHMPVSNCYECARGSMSYDGDI